MTSGTLSDDWLPLLHELTARLENLTVGHWINLSEARSTVPAPPRPTGLLARFRRPVEPHRRYIQFLGYEDGGSAEVVGPNGWPSSDAQQRRLVEAGWAEPESDAEYLTPNFLRAWETGQEPQIATTSLQALQILGADPTVEWTWERDDE